MTDAALAGQEGDVWAGLNPPYGTITADPPWPTGVKGSGYVRGVGRRYGSGGRRRRATSLGYSTMPLEDIYALPVAALAAENCALWLWVTAGHNRAGAGLACATAWGFTVVGEFVWRKPNYGMGAFPRPQHEILLVCRRGSVRFTRGDVGSVQEWRQSYANNGGKAHSAKPPAAYDLIESVSAGPYVELFARTPRLGWDHWGHGFEGGGAMMPETQVLPDWLYVGAPVVDFTPSYRGDGATIRSTTVKSIGKRDIVLENGARYNVRYLRRGGKDWSPSSDLLPPGDPRIERARKENLRTRRFNEVWTAWEQFRKTKTDSDASALEAALQRYRAAGGDSDG